MKLPGNQEHEIEVAAKLVAAQATQQCPALWSSAPQFTSKNFPDNPYSNQNCHVT